MSTPLYQNAITRTISGAFGDNPSFLDFGTTDGVHDCSATFNTAIQSVAAAGRGSLYVPGGVYVIENPILLNTNNFTLYGDPEQTLIQPNFTGPNGNFPTSSLVTAGSGTITVGQGILDVTGLGVRIRGLGMNSGITTAVNVAGTGEPDQLAFIQNSMIWVHGKVQDLMIDECNFQNGSGYVMFIDARTTGNINNVLIQNCVVRNHRPFSFGSGGWGTCVGAVFVKNLGDGSTNSYYTSNLEVKDNTFERISGNVVWCHSNNFDATNVNFQINDNKFAYNGQDAVSLGNVNNASVDGNVIHACGYICTTNTSTPTVTIGGANPCGIDTTSNVYNSSYSNNKILNVCGEGIDCDGFYNGIVANNVIELSDVSDPFYAIDQLANYPVQYCRGIQPSNTYAALGGSNIIISGNTIRNMTYTSISMSNCKECVVVNNRIWQTGAYPNPALPEWSPIIMFCLNNLPNNSFSGGTAQLNRSWGNLITNNVITYGADTYAYNFAIVEVTPQDTSLGFISFVNTDPPNRVYGNIITGGNYGEWWPASTVTGSTSVAQSSSYGGFEISTENASYATSQISPVPITSLWQRVGVSPTGATRLSTNTAGVKVEVLQISDAGFLNVSVNGAANTGSIGLSNRGSTAFNDVFAGGKAALDSFVSFTDTTYVAGDANLLPATYGIIRYVSATSTFQISNSVSAGARVWSNLSGAASLTGTANEILVTGSTSAGYTIALTPSVVISGTYTSTNTGTNVTFQNGGGNFSVLANGQLTAQVIGAGTSFEGGGYWLGAPQATGSVNAISGLGDFLGVNYTAYLAPYGSSFTTASTNVTFQNAGGNFSVLGNGTLVAQVIGAGTSLTGGGYWLGAPGGGSINVISGTGTFTSPVTGTGISFQNQGGDFSITGAGNLAAQSITAGTTSGYWLGALGTGTNVISGQGTFTSAYSGVTFQNAGGNFSVNGSGILTAQGIGAGTSSGYWIGVPGSGTNVISGSQTFTSAGTGVTFQNAGGDFSVLANGTVTGQVFGAGTTLSGGGYWLGTPGSGTAVISGAGVHTSPISIGGGIAFQSLGGVYSVTGSGYLQALSVGSGTSGYSLGGTTASIVLASTASTVNNAYYGQTILIVSGTGAGETSTITSYTGSSRTVTVSGFATAPDTSSFYVISNGYWLGIPGAGVAVISGTGTITSPINIGTAVSFQNSGGDFSVLGNGTLVAQVIGAGTSLSGGGYWIGTPGSGIQVINGTGHFVGPGGGGVTSLAAGTGISLSATTGAITVTNTGITSLAAGTGVAVSGSTISIGQSVATNVAPTFSGIYLNPGGITCFATGSSNILYQAQGTCYITGSGICAMQTVAAGGTGSPNGGGYWIGPPGSGTQVINGNGWFVGLVDSAQITATLGYYANVGGVTYTGQSWIIGWNGSVFTINGSAAEAFLVFKYGLLCGESTTG